MKKIRLMPYIVLASAVCGASYGQQPVSMALHIPSQPLDKAIAEWAQQTGYQVLMPVERADATTPTATLMGTYAPEDALGVLLTGSEFDYRFVNPRTVAIRAVAGPKEIHRPQGEDTVYFRQSADSSSGVSNPTQRTNQNNPERPASSVSPSAETKKLEEVVVTARRREESLQDVPLSIIAKTGEDLMEAQVDSVDELYRAMPGFFVQANVNQPVAQYYIRGIGTTAFDSGSDSSVGVAVDGAIMPFTSAFGEDYNDIERVEMLRGPQGTLFGKNASAGLLNITTKDPTESFSGTMGVGYGSYDEMKLNGALSGPVVGESLLGRLSFSVSQRDGFQPDLTGGGKRGDLKQHSARGVLLYRPTESTRLRLSYYDVRRDADNLALDSVRSFGPLSSADEVQFFSDIAGPTNVAVKTAGTGQLLAPTHFWGSILQWDQQLGDHTLTSITSYLDYQWQQQISGGFSSTPVPANPLTTDNQVYDAELWTQELRIASPSGGRVDYVAGLYLFDEARANGFRLVIPSALLYWELDASVDTLNYAAFGEANWHLTDQVTLITGARWTHEEKDLLSDAGAPPAGFFGILNSAAPGRTTDSASADNLSWRVGLQWNPSQDLMVYATAAQGFKGPAFNTVNFRQNATQQVDPEEAITYEVGAKTSWFDRRLSADIAVFHTEFEDLQVRANGFVVGPDGTPVLGTTGRPLTAFVLSNAASLRSRGVELEIQALPLKNLDVTLAGAYIDAEYEEYVGAPCYQGQLQFGQGCSLTGTIPTQDLSGVSLNTPKLSGNLGARYELEFPALPYNGFIRADYAWRDKQAYRATLDPNGYMPSLGLLSASVGLVGKEGHYSLTVYGKNLTDEFYVAGVGGGFGTVLQGVSPDYQRIYGVMFNANF